MMPQEFDPKTQRLSFKFAPPRAYKLPKLTEMQLAVLACARDDMIRKGVKYIWKNLPFVEYTVTVPFGKRRTFSVTTQVRSLTKRKLMKWAGRDRRHDAHFHLTAWGIETLAEHPEF